MAEDWLEDFYDDPRSSGFEADDILEGFHDTGYHQPKTFGCPKCSLAFPSFEAVTKHKRSTPSKHLMCMHCLSPVDFSTPDRLISHYETNHRKTYCTDCTLHFKTPEKKANHDEEEHFPCHSCQMHFASSSLRESHFATSPAHQRHFCHERQSNFAHPAYLRVHAANAHPKPKSKPRRAEVLAPGEKPPDHYATLNILRHSTHEEILVAAKRRRIETHPDSFKRRGGELAQEEVDRLEEEAKKVGWAADILSDVILRENYDARLHAWEKTQDVESSWWT